MFRVDFAVEIKVQAALVKIQEQAYTETEFRALLQGSGFDRSKYMSADLFEPDFDFRAILGELNLLS